MTKPKLDFKLLNYDIESAHIKVRLWRLGKQVVRHGQLLPNAYYTKILTISYKWHHENKIHTLDCGEDGSKMKEMIAKFDEEIKKADVVIGKNNERFDNTHINTIRLLEEGTPMPEWAYKSEDIEKQLRRYFNFQSNSLDYVAKLLGLGGKMKMEEEDWNSIEDMIEFLKIKPLLKSGMIAANSFCKYMFDKTSKQVLVLGRIAFKKMKKYNRVDIIRTEGVIDKVLPHVTLKHNAATKYKQVSPFACIACGSRDVIKSVILTRGQTMRQEFKCTSHKGYAGSRACKRDNYGHIQFTSPMGK